MTTIIEDGNSSARRHLLFITGTGRAGTSFLVRFSAAMGLDTHLQRQVQPGWSEEANAGLEDMPLATTAGELPYVVKTAWLGEFVDDLLANKDIHIDGVIIPMRDLAEAASSRVIQELQARHRAHPWQASSSRTSETWGLTPGGVVFSLNPVDQGRLLAVWLHQLVHRLERADVPIVFLDFPRLAQDPDYLFRKLRSFLPADATVEQARAAHLQVADPLKIRVGEELRRASAPAPVHAAVEYPDLEALDRIALAREVARLTAALERARATPAAPESSADTGPGSRRRWRRLRRLIARVR